MTQKKGVPPGPNSPVCDKPEGMVESFSAVVRGVKLETKEVKKEEKGRAPMRA